MYVFRTPGSLFAFVMDCMVRLRCQLWQHRQSGMNDGR